MYPGRRSKIHFPICARRPDHRWNRCFLHRVRSFSHYTQGTCSSSSCILHRSNRGWYRQDRSLSRYFLHQAHICCRCTPSKQCSISDTRHLPNYDQYLHGRTADMSVRLRYGNHNHYKRYTHHNESGKYYMHQKYDRIPQDRILHRFSQHLSYMVCQCTRGNKFRNGHMFQYCYSTHAVSMLCCRKWGKYLQMHNPIHRNYKSTHTEPHSLHRIRLSKYGHRLPIHR